MGLQSYAGRGMWYLGVHKQNQSCDDRMEQKTVIPGTYKYIQEGK